MRKARWPGEWQAACQVCGWVFPSGDIKRRWDGLLVCKQDYETRHPQDMIKVRGERHFPSFISPEPSEIYQGVCSIVTSSSYADLGTADCMQASVTTYSYTMLYDLTTSGH